MKLHIREAFTNPIPNWLHDYAVEQAKDYHSNNMKYTPVSVPRNRDELRKFLKGTDLSGDVKNILQYINPETGENKIIDTHHYTWGVIDPRTGEEKNIWALPYSLIAKNIQNCGTLEYECHSSGSQRQYDRGIAKSRDPLFLMSKNIIKKKFEDICDMRYTTNFLSDMEKDYPKYLQAGIVTPSEEKEIAQLLNQVGGYDGFSKKYANAIEIALCYLKGYVSSYEQLVDEYGTEPIENVLKTLDTDRKLYDRLRRLYGDIANRYEKLERERLSNLPPTVYEVRRAYEYGSAQESAELWDWENSEELLDRLQKAGWVKGYDIYIPKGTRFIYGDSDAWDAGSIPYDTIIIQGGPFDGLEIPFRDDGNLSRAYFVKKYAKSLA